MRSFSGCLSAQLFKQQLEPIGDILLGIFVVNPPQILVDLLFDFGAPALFTPFVHLLDPEKLVAMRFNR